MTTHHLPSLPPSRRRRTRAATLAVTSIAVATAAIWLAGPASAATTHDLAEAWNPLGGITPDFSLFGPTVGQTWRRVMGAFWAACLAACTIWVVLAGAKWSSANRRGFAGQQVEAKSSFVDACVGLAACAAASVIIAGVLFAVGV
ncbi:hypothetical protein GTV32_22935 [Gordonia sp. SID5947]|uniref:hypothetical protein n=1 Tax=Gordonia sp. SID5947 TaxID=2690315 RepID=UPI00136FFFC8|nr:hypothetical protein [Gordonia sp. SID5947]MYR08992.1 hypothetical protein [Gordonia sp. SID5947]